MTVPDLFRSVMISLAALLIGTVLVGAYTAWRDRHMPVPRRAPIVAVFLFVAGYISLLLELVVDRWVKLGESMDPSSWVAMVALTLNTVAMIVMVRNAKPGPALAERYREHRETVKRFREAMGYLQTLNVLNWRQQHGDGHVPSSRYSDKLLTLSDDELSRLIDLVKDGEEATP